MPKGPVEHVILSPKFGQMPGFVRAVNPQGVIFYEISVFAQAGDSLTVREAREDSFTVYFLNRTGQEERDTLVIPFHRK